MLNILTLIIFIGGLSAMNNSYAQGDEGLKPRKIKKFVRKGRNAYRKGEYWKAKSYYDRITNANSPKSQYWLEAGMVYYDSQVEREKAIIY